VINVSKVARAGCAFKLWVADYFAQMNNKINGDLKKIQTVGNYMIEVWKAAGMDFNQVQVVWSSEEISKRAGEYWPLVMDIGRCNKLPRIKRCPNCTSLQQITVVKCAQFTCIKWFLAEQGA
jgi:tyrosyl-tRNA synthetase